jgi:hypothetical protein
MQYNNIALASYETKKKRLADISHSLVSTIREEMKIYGISSPVCLAMSYILQCNQILTTTLMRGN